jgi:hypothetical protein
MNHQTCSPSWFPALRWDHGGAILAIKSPIKRTHAPKVQAPNAWKFSQNSLGTSSISTTLSSLLMVVS